MTRIVIDKTNKIDSVHGFDPETCSIEQRLASGFILLDKAAGPTSHQVAAWVLSLIHI